MSDFLGRMAGRTLGTLPLAQPLIPSTFASDAAAPEPVVAEIAAPPETSAAPPQVTPPRPHREHVPETSEQAAPIPATPQAIPAQPVVAVKRETLPAVPHREETHEAAAAPIASRHPAQFHPAPESHEARPTPPEPHETLPPPPFQRPSTAAAAVTPPRLAPPRPAAASPAEAAPPVIRVTIGRVDVRAEFPPAPAPRSASPRQPAPALSLDDYLKQRIEGKR